MQNIFSTERLPLAIFLHASNRLRLVNCELAEQGKVEFIFADPEHKGDEVELAFEHGEAVPAKNLFASQTYLRRRMSDALNNRKDNYNRKLEYACQPRRNRHRR